MIAGYSFFEARTSLWLLSACHRSTKSPASPTGSSILRFFLLLFLCDLLLDLGLGSYKIEISYITSLCTQMGPHTDIPSAADAEALPLIRRMYLYNPHDAGDPAVVLMRLPRAAWTGCTGFRELEVLLVFKGSRCFALRARSVDFLVSSWRSGKGETLRGKR